MLVPFAVREEICRLINVHQVPFFALEQSRRGVTPSSPCANCRAGRYPPAGHAGRGRHPGTHRPDPQRILDAIELFRELAREEGCYGQRRAFVDDHASNTFAAPRRIPIIPVPGAGSHVIVMSGLPCVRQEYVGGEAPSAPARRLV
jgi:hypothetical protein